MNTVTAIKSLVLAKKSDIKLLLKQVIITAIIKSNIRSNNCAMFL